jgi:hypothetical protein
MLMPRHFTLPVLAVAALLIPAQGILAQGKRPSFPPGLHDRTLPPGRPFDGGGFDPPGLAQRPMVLGAAEAEELGALISCPVFAASHDLSDAVSAFNLWVVQLADEELEAPPPSLLRAHGLLRQHLGIQDANGDTPTLGNGSSNGHGPHGNDPRRSYLLPTPAQMWREAYGWVFPGMSAATPTGFGADFGMVWASASYQPRARYSDGQTGQAAVGFGLGDARRLVGLQVSVTSFSTVSSGFGNRMGLDLHLHRTLAGVYGVAVGWESAVAHEAAIRDSGENLYAVASRWLQLRSNPNAAFGVGMISLGVGSGRFQTESDFVDGRDGVGVFGSVGVRVAPPISLVAEWTGQDLMLATSLTPLRNQRLGITAGLTELTGAAGDGPRFAVGASVGLDMKGR